MGTRIPLTWSQTTYPINWSNNPYLWSDVAYILEAAGSAKTGQLGLDEWQQKYPEKLPISSIIRLTL